MIKYSSRSEKGLVRENNEDSLLYIEIGEYLVLAVADGLGGVQGGEIASKIAIQTISSELKLGLHDNSSNEEIEELLRNVFQAANMRILIESSTNYECSEMATTLTVAVVCASKVIIGHIGDCRVYVVNNDKMDLLTSDHTYLQELKKSTSFSDEEIANHPGRNMLTKVLGENVYVMPDFYKYNISNGDYILLCTDGLSSYVGDDMIKDVVLNSNDTDSAVLSLVNSVYDVGAKDNVTAILAKIED